MIQDVIIKRVQITKIGEQHYFQINIPRGAERIIGVEVGVFINRLLVRQKPVSIKRFFIRRNKVVGEVRLQMPNQPNFFYATKIVSEDNNIGTDDIVALDNRGYAGRRIDQPPVPIPKMINAPFKSLQHTHGSPKKLDEILTCNERIIYGCYKDIIGKAEFMDLNYTIQVYVWYQQED